MSAVSRALARAAVFALPLIAPGIVSAPASAQPFFAEGAYLISLRGINVARASIGFEQDGERYRVAINGAFSGIAAIIADGEATMSSSGRARDTALVSESFLLAARTETEAFSFGYEAQNGTVTDETIYPPLPENVPRVPIRNGDRRGVNDPIAAFLIKADALGPELCDRQLEVFTGIERYELELGYLANQEATSQRTGYQGPVVLCSIRYKPISGHFVHSESTAYLAETDRFLVWYAPLADTGYMIPYRVIMGTAYGDLSMVLTDLSGV